MPLAMCARSPRANDFFLTPSVAFCRSEKLLRYLAKGDDERNKRYCQSGDSNIVRGWHFCVLMFLSPTPEEIQNNTGFSSNGKVTWMHSSAVQPKACVFNVQLDISAQVSNLHIEHISQRQCSTEESIFKPNKADSETRPFDSFRPSRPQIALGHGKPHRLPSKKDSG